MNYASVQDMIDRYGAPEMIQLTDPDIVAVQAPKAQRALDDAQAFADGFVGASTACRWLAAPSPAPVPGDLAAVQYVAPPQLTRIVCDVARYYLYDDLAPEHEVYLRYKAASTELGQIAEGKNRAVLPLGRCAWPTGGRGRTG